MPTIILETLTCVRTADVLGRDEPYMWNFFFGLDSPPIEDTGTPGTTGDPLRVATLDPLVFAPAAGHHGNLGVSRISRGQTITIPPSVGRMTIPVADRFITGAGGVPTFNFNWASVGVISMLLERDLDSDAGIASGYVAMRMLIESQLRDMVNSKLDQPFARPALQPADVQNALAPLLQRGLPGQVRAAIMGGQSPLQNLASIINPDDLVGMEVFMLDMDQLTPIPVEIPLSGSYNLDGIYQVNGRITNP